MSRLGIESDRILSSYWIRLSYDDRAKADSFLLNLCGEGREKALTFRKKQKDVGS